jgi:2-phospho-L-lactate transferase/gluconeogenesis factor (CofD/UPF0052 family)
MWQPGETMDFRASDHVRAIHDHAGPRLLDYAVVNVASVRPYLKRKYLSQQVRPVEVDLEELNALGVEVVAGHLLHESTTVRHDPASVAAVALRLASKGRQRRLSHARKSLWKQT